VNAPDGSVADQAAEAEPLRVPVDRLAELTARDPEYLFMHDPGTGKVKSVIHHRAVQKALLNDGRIVAAAKFFASLQAGDPRKEKAEQRLDRLVGDRIMSWSTPNRISPSPRPSGPTSIGRKGTSRERRPSSASRRTSTRAGPRPGRGEPGDGDDEPSPDLSPAAPGLPAWIWMAA
jgi:hypothetical protein